MNLSMTYKVEKCYHNGKNYIYLYECLPKKSWAVVVYDEDDDTIISSEYFTDWKIALNQYNKIKDKGE